MYPEVAIEDMAIHYKLLQGPDGRICIRHKQHLAFTTIWADRYGIYYYTDYILRPIPEEDRITVQKTLDAINSINPTICMMLDHEGCVSGKGYLRGDAVVSEYLLDIIYEEVRVAGKQLYPLLERMCLWNSFDDEADW